MLVQARDANGKIHSLQAIPNGDGTYSLDIGTTDVTIGSISIPAIGAIDDPTWDVSSEASVVSILRSIGLSEASVSDAVGSPASGEWSGMDSGSIIAILKAQWIILNSSLDWLNTVAGNTNPLSAIQTAVEAIQAATESSLTILSACQSALEQIVTNTSG